MTAAGKAAAGWAGLNPRQRLYLSTTLDFDQAAEADIRHRSANGEKTPPASEWRQILYDIKLPKAITGSTRDSTPNRPYPPAELSSRTAMKPPAPQHRSSSDETVQA
ncbi:hypothetical protein [Nocardia sp. NBC_01329]|uniref:hypothetical protein n=1 Tax=Nocardia sp. NBC_01329 TaxID=2903594 RepID=UPI002E138656|nr:hypothetical protein OG405_09635 [Nocardia sp. NBC_01329]